MIRNLLTCYSKRPKEDCQPMVLGTNSTAPGIPNLECAEEGHFIQCKQLNSDTARMWQRQGRATRRPEVRGPRHFWGEAPLWLDSSALLCSVLLCPALPCLALPCSSLLHLLLSVFRVSPRPAREIPSVQSKGKVCSLRQRAADLQRQKSPPMVPE